MKMDYNEFYYGIMGFTLLLSGAVVLYGTTR